MFKCGLGLCAIYDGLLVFAIWWALSIFTLVEVYFLFSLAILFQIVLLMSVQKIWFSDKDIFEKRKFVQLVLLSVLGGIFLEACTVIGTPQHSVVDFNEWNIKRILLFSCIVYALLAVGIVLFPKIRSYLAGRHISKKQLIAILIVGFISISASLCIGLCAHFIAELSFFPSFFCSLLIITCIGAIALFYRFSVSIEMVFVPLVLSVGLSIAIIPPAITGLSWDDQIHFARTYGISYLIDPSFSDGERLLAVAAYGLDTLMPDESTASVSSFDEKVRETQQQNIIDWNGAVEINGTSSTLSIASYSYMPAAIGIWIGRLLHLGLVRTFVLGKIFNTVFYAIVCFMAIRIIPVKKTLLAVIALIPTSIFLASNYSYDGWINALFLLAIAMTVKQMYATEWIDPWDIVALFLVYFFALAPKAIYFPLLGMLFFIPKRRFRSKRLWVNWVALIVLFGAVVAMSFVLPFLAQGAYGNDMRGGEAVNSKNQIAFILSNPGVFLTILNSEAWNVFFNPANFNLASIHFSYLGQLSNDVPFFKILPLLLVFLIAITDSDHRSYRLTDWKRKLWIAFLVIVSASLVFTSLYVSFNEVGIIPEDDSGIITIGGVQERYILPFLFPLFGFLLNLKVNNEMDARVYSLMSQMGMTIFGWICVVAYVVMPMTA